MGTQLVTDALVVTKTALSPHQNPMELALFTPAGVPLVPLTVATNRMVVQADSVAATVGALVTDFNALLTKLKNSGLMATS